MLIIIYILLLLLAYEVNQLDLSMGNVRHLLLIFILGLLLSLLVVIAAGSWIVQRIHRLEIRLFGVQTKMTDFFKKLK